MYTHLDIPYQQSEKHQPAKHNDYAENHFHPVTCRLKIVAERAENISMV